MEQIQVISATTLGGPSQNLWIRILKWLKFSNTFNLVKNYNARAVYIEGDESKYLDLLQTCKKYPNIVPIKKFISPANDENSIDQVLSKTFLKKNIRISVLYLFAYSFAFCKGIQSISTFVAPCEKENNELQMKTKRIRFFII